MTQGATAVWFCWSDFAVPVVREVSRLPRAVAAGRDGGIRAQLYPVPAEGAGGRLERLAGEDEGRGGGGHYT